MARKKLVETKAADSETKCPSLHDREEIRLHGLNERAERLYGIKATHFCNYFGECEYQHVVRKDKKSVAAYCKVLGEIV